MRRLLPALALAPLLAACSSTGTTSSSYDSVLTASNTSCALSTTLVNAGLLRLGFVNGASQPISVTLSISGNQVGAVGPIPAGKSARLTKELAAGDYDISCGDTGKIVVLKVSGTTLPSADPALTAAVANYRAYVTRAVAHMVPLVAAFVAAVDRGDVAAAKAAYSPSRFGWEAIEPVAEAFGNLDPRMDAREADLAQGDSWTGWHRIEKELWTKGDLTGMKRYADQLQRDVSQLQRLIPDAPMTPKSIATGASELVDEISNRKITGEEEVFSHTDLYDFSANLEGAYQGYLAVKPVMTDKALGPILDARFRDVFKALQPYKRGDSFVLYSTVDLAHRKALSDVVNALGEPLGALASAV